MPAGQLLRRTLRPDRQNRTHRPHPDLRRAAPAGRPRPVQRPLQRPPATPSTATCPATPRSPRPDQTPPGTGRTDQRVRTRSLKPQVSTCGRVLEPHRSSAVSNLRHRVELAHHRARPTSGSTTSTSRRSPGQILWGERNGMTSTLVPRVSGAFTMTNPRAPQNSVHAADLPRSYRRQPGMIPGGAAADLPDAVQAPAPDGGAPPIRRYQRDRDLVLRHP